MSELQKLRDRIDELEELLGLMIQLPNSFGMRLVEVKILGMLVRREIVSTEMIYAAVYGNRLEHEQPEIQIIKLYIFRMRRALAPLGYSILNHHGVGYFMPASERAKLKECCEFRSPQKVAA